MADSKKKQTKVYLIPESESRDSHTYHYLAVKTCGEDQEISY